MVEHIIFCGLAWDYLLLFAFGRKPKEYFLRELYCINVNDEIVLRFLKLLNGLDNFRSLQRCSNQFLDPIHPSSSFAIQCLLFLAHKAHVEALDMAFVFLQKRLIVLHDYSPSFAIFFLFNKKQMIQ